METELAEDVSVQDENETVIDESKEHQEDEEDQETVEYFCGIGKCRPKFLQIFRSAYFFTFLICCNVFIEGGLAVGEAIS